VQNVVIAVQPHTMANRADDQLGRRAVSVYPTFGLPALSPSPVPSPVPPLPSQLGRRATRLARWGADAFFSACGGALWLFAQTCAAVVVLLPLSLLLVLLLRHLLLPSPDLLLPLHFSGHALDPAELFGGPLRAPPSSSAPGAHLPVAFVDLCLDGASVGEGDGGGGGGGDWVWGSGAFRATDDGPARHRPPPLTPGQSYEVEVTLEVSPGAAHMDHHHRGAVAVVHIDLLTPRPTPTPRNDDDNTEPAPTDDANAGPGAAGAGADGDGTGAAAHLRAAWAALSTQPALAQGAAHTSLARCARLLRLPRKRPRLPRLYRLVHELLWLPLWVAGLASAPPNADDVEGDAVTQTVTCFTNYVEGGGGGPTTGVRVLLSDASAAVHGGTLSVRARVRGLAGLLRRWGLTSTVVLTLALTAAGLVAASAVSVAVRLWRGHGVGLGLPRPAWARRPRGGAHPVSGPGTRAPAVASTTRVVEEGRGERLPFRGSMAASEPVPPGAAGVPGPLVSSLLLALQEAGRALAAEEGLAGEEEEADEGAGAGDAAPASSSSMVLREGEVRLPAPEQEDEDETEDGSGLLPAAEAAADAALGLVEGSEGGLRRRPARGRQREGRDDED
jgi:hypothetical protein